MLEANFLNTKQQSKLKSVIKMDLVIKQNREESESYAAREIADLIRAKNGNNEKVVLGFATGGTYEGIYSKLIKITEKESIDWSNVTTFNLDEYVWRAFGYLDENRRQYYDKESYREFMHRNLFNWLKKYAGLKEDNINLLNGLTDNPESEAAHYEEKIMKETSGQGVDLQVLGIGVEGHIAFIEARPEMELKDFLNIKTKLEKLALSTRKANSRFFGDKIDAVPAYAMTQGVSTILKARKLILVATGSKKEEVVTKTVAELPSPLVPASVLQLHKNTKIIIDETAAAGLIELSRAK